MSERALRRLRLGLVATAGAGVLGLTAITYSAAAHGDDIGLVMGGSGEPIPGSDGVTGFDVPDYVQTANDVYLDNTSAAPPLGAIYPGLTFYQATPSNPFGEGLYTPEGLYPLLGEHTLLLNYPQDPDGVPTVSSSEGQGMTILENTIAADTAAGDTSTVFGYSQSSTISGLVMQQLDPSGTPQPNSGLDFLLVGDPSAPNGGLFERFDGFQTLSGQTVTDPLSLPSLGVVFDSATPADYYTTSVFTLEYDGFADFPRYPLDFLSDLNAFLGIIDIHTTYLTDFTPSQIADDAFLLPGSQALGTADSLTNYYMIDQTPPLVSLLESIPTIGKPLADLLGPDLTVLINLGYGSLTDGYSPDPANIATPFGLWPTDISSSDLLGALQNGAQEGWTNFVSDLQNFSPSSLDPVPSEASFTDLLSALSADAADPSATFTDLANALSTAASAAYSTLLPTADIINALVTSLPAYDASLFSDNLATGDLLDAIGLPIAANTAMDTLAAGFEISVLQDAATQITDAFSGLF
jgi:hypothetical protein